MKTKITMQDIAKIAGVSRMTVSRYFSGGYVSKENKTKIKAIIDAHDYTPNVYAQSLKKKLDIIGIILPTIVSRTSTRLLKGIIDEAEQKNYDYLITTAENDVEKERAAVQNFRNLNVKGVISLTVNPELYNNQFSDMDIVIITHAGIKLPAVIYPDEQAVKQIITEYIKPHQDKIKKVCLLADDTMLTTRATFVTEQMQELLPNMPFVQVTAAHNVEGPLATKLEKSTFYICVTDQIAYNLYETATQEQLLIGKDIYVIGFGDYTTSRSQVPPLTSVSFPYYEAGVKAMDKLLHLHDHTQTQNEYMDFEIKKRASTV